MPSDVFSGKVCIVTGGASGIGCELGKQLAASGAQVVLADINEVRLAEVAAQITRAGGKAKALRVDVTEPDSVRALVRGTKADFGRLDYIFNNAGTADVGDVRDLSLEQWRRVIEVNLFGVIHGVHFAYPIMIDQGFGHIVNTSSLAGIIPSPIEIPYVASKFAVLGLSQALAIEARALGVDVSVICPGFVQTPLLGVTPVNATSDDLQKLIPLKPLPVERAVRIILAGVARKKIVILFPAHAHVFVFMHRFLPPLFRAFGARLIRQFRAIRRVG